MTKRSCYEVTITAFLPANADDPDSMVAAVRVIRSAVVALSEAGFLKIEARPRYRARAEIPDEPLPQAETEGDPDFGEVEEPPTGPLDNRDPTMPATLARGRKTAAE